MAWEARHHLRTLAQLFDDLNFWEVTMRCASLGVAAPETGAQQFEGLHYSLAIFRQSEGLLLSRRDHDHSAQGCECNELPWEIVPMWITPCKGAQENPSYFARHCFLSRLSESSFLTGSGLNMEQSVDGRSVGWQAEVHGTSFTH